MGFSDNLKQIRKEHHLSQEELAALLDVSRQAVSKWEQGIGYPEVETLLVLSQKLHVSLDHLMSTEIIQDTQQIKKDINGKITVSSPHENVVVSCYKVISSGRMKGGKHAPHYALFAVSDTATFWGQPTTFLGWYTDKEQIAKEMTAITEAIKNSTPFYTLQYSVKVKRHGMMMRVDSQEIQK